MAKSWAKCGEEIDRKLLRQVIRTALQGVTRNIRIGRSSNRAGIGNNTPIEVVRGDNPPSLEGSPYLMTLYRKGNFSKTLYTPSTLRVIVGDGWLRSKEVTCGSK